MSIIRCEYLTQNEYIRAVRAVLVDDFFRILGCLNCSKVGHASLLWILARSVSP